MSNRINVYAAGGWFHSRDAKALEQLETFLSNHTKVNVYRPRVDGVKLGTGEFHDPKLREKVFLDNIKHIDVADFVVALLDGAFGQDTGTCYEVGYAMARGIPVIAYTIDAKNRFDETLGSIKDGMYAIVEGMEALAGVIAEIDPSVYPIANLEYEYTPDTNEKVLFISPDTSEDVKENSIKAASVLMECYGKDLRWIDKTTDNPLCSAIDAIFTDVNYMVGVIDDKNPIVSWAFGQAFARNIPIISFTNYNWDVNIMLLCSILQHVKGVDALRDVVHDVKRYGISNLEKSDTSGIRAY